MIGYGIFVPMKEGLEKVAKYKGITFKQILEQTFTMPVTDKEEIKEFDKDPWKFWNESNSVLVENLSIPNNPLTFKSSSDTKTLFIGLLNQIEQCIPFSPSKYYCYEDKYKLCYLLQAITFKETADIYISTDHEFEF